MRNMTSADFSKETGVDYSVSAGLMKFLVQSGQAKVVGKTFHASGKGRPQRVYRVPNVIKIAVANERKEKAVKKVVKVKKAV